MSGTVTPAALRALLEAAGLSTRTIAADAQDRVAQYLALRAQWAQVHNLSGPAALRSPWETDVVDAVATLAACSPPGTLVDVGAGSGVPGLLVACLDPSRPVVLVEPLVKRTAFLRSAAQTLGLRAVQVVRGRWPLVGAEAERVAALGPLQVVSRAVVSPEVWPALAASAGVAVGAVLRMLAAQRPTVELPGFALAHAVDYTAQGISRRVERWDRQAPV